MDLPKIWTRDCNCYSAFIIVSAALVFYGYIIFLGVVGYFIGRLAGTLIERFKIRDEMIIWAKNTKKGRIENEIVRRDFYC